MAPALHDSGPLESLIRSRSNIALGRDVVRNEGVLSSGHIRVSCQLDPLENAAIHLLLLLPGLPFLVRLVFTLYDARLVKWRLVIRLVDEQEFTAMAAEIANPDAPPRFLLRRGVQLGVESGIRIDFFAKVDSGAVLASRHLHPPPNSKCLVTDL